MSGVATEVPPKPEKTMGDVVLLGPALGMAQSDAAGFDTE